MTRDPDEHALAQVVQPVRNAPAEQSPAGRTAADWRVLRGGAEWADGMLVLALLAVCAGAGLAVAVRSLWPEAPPTAAAIPGEVAATVVVAGALVRARPPGLLRGRWLDMLWGLGWGLVGLVVAGWIATSVGAAGGFPATTGLTISSGRGVLLVDAAVKALLAPILSTLLVSGVLLVSAFTVIRRRWSLTSAAIIAGALSVVSALLLSVAVDAGATAAILATVMTATCSALVLLTGRVWGAILAQVVAAGGYALLALIGTLWP